VVPDLLNVLGALPVHVGTSWEVKR
jgi:hypothetical protein